MNTLQPANYKSLDQADTRTPNQYHDTHHGATHSQTHLVHARGQCRRALHLDRSKVKTHAGSRITNGHKGFARGKESYEEERKTTNLAGQPQNAEPNSCTQSAGVLLSKTAMARNLGKKTGDQENKTEKDEKQSTILVKDHFFHAWMTPVRVETI